VLTQTPLQSVCPDGQLATQVPLTQLWPVEQSALVQQAVAAMQVPLQSFCPVGQLATQVPFAHVWLDLHLVPQ
jgi:hypothetical protein